MIVKSFELQKINLVRDKLLLFYGDNEGFKKQVIEKLIENRIICISRFSCGSICK